MWSLYIRTPRFNVTLTHPHQRFQGFWNLPHEDLPNSFEILSCNVSAFTQGLLSFLLSCSASPGSPSEKLCEDPWPWPLWPPPWRVLLSDAATVALVQQQPKLRTVLGSGESHTCCCHTQAEALGTSVNQGSQPLPQVFLA